jgi:large subunit ribosomal protein L32e
MVKTIKKKAKPKFNVQNLGFMKSVKPRWRKPRGMGNKKRRKHQWAGASPRVGYKNPKAIRGNHPSGLPEVLVANPKQLDGVKGKLVRIISAVGAMKALDIMNAAKAAGLTVLNPRNVELRGAASIGGVAKKAAANVGTAKKEGA